MQLTNDLSRYQLVPLLFAQDAVADAQTDVALFTTDANNSCSLNVGYTMPWEGYVVAISANLNAAGSTGTLVIDASVNATPLADPSVSITTETEKSDHCNRNTAHFAADDVIGASITTASWNGTTSDLQVIVWVLLKISGI